MKIVYAVTGSFCNLASSLDVLGRLVKSGNDVYPVFSESVCRENTRFGKCGEFFEAVTSVTGRIPLTTVTEAEATVTKGNFDVLLICPCTGNTLAKLANGITDTAVTMAAKCRFRNSLPVLIALASNDALGANLKNIGILCEKKNVFFVPLVQDDPQNKPTSLVCDFSSVEKALEAAANGTQLRPLIK